MGRRCWCWKPRCRPSSPPRSARRSAASPSGRRASRASKTCPSASPCCRPTCRRRQALHRRPMSDARRAADAEPGRGAGAPDAGAAAARIGDDRDGLHLRRPGPRAGRRRRLGHRRAAGRQHARWTATRCACRRRAAARAPCCRSASASRPGVVGAPLAAGTAARIFTGAQVPAGADAVVMQEQCEAVDDAACASTPCRSPASGSAAAAKTCACGATVLARGTRLTPQALGLAAGGRRRDADVSAAARAWRCFPPATNW